MSTGHMDKQVALENLLIIRDLFAEHGIPMFLTFGTLLGALREKDFIDHDDDVDVGVFERDRHAILALMPELEKRGFKLLYVRSERLYKLERRKTELDFFVAVSKRTLRGRRWDLEGKATIAARYLDRLDEIEFLGHRFPVPHVPLGVVRSLYGRTWIVPIPDSTSRQDWSKRIKMVLRNPGKVFFYARRYFAGRRRARVLRRQSIHRQQD
jgi:lipopolysaccharide cholinephosphotransferase